MSGREEGSLSDKSLSLVRKDLLRNDTITTQLMTADAQTWKIFTQSRRFHFKA